MKLSRISGFFLRRSSLSVPLRQHYRCSIGNLIVGTLSDGAVWFGSAESHSWEKISLPLLFTVLNC